MQSLRGDDGSDVNSYGEFYVKATEIKSNMLATDRPTDRPLWLHICVCVLCMLFPYHHVITNKFIAKSLWLNSYGCGNVH